MARVLLDVTRVGFAASTVVAMTYMLATLQDVPDFSAGNSFRFFMIQSNILAAAMLALAAIVRREERARARSTPRGVR